MTIRVASAGLGWCGMSCISSAITGAIEDAFEFGDDAFDTALSVPSHIRDRINQVKHHVFDGWAAFVEANNFIGKELVNAFNAAYDGIKELGSLYWDYITWACRQFREYREYINIGVQVAQQDYVNAAANLAEVAAREMGVPPVVQGTDSQAVQLAGHICAAIEGIAVVAALANGMPPPPPLPPANDLVVVDGVAKPRRILPGSRYRVAAHALTHPSAQVVFNEDTTPVRTAAANSSKAPTIIVGASAVAALLLFSSRSS